MEKIYMVMESYPDDADEILFISQYVYKAEIFIEKLPKPKIEYHYYWIKDTMKVKVFLKMN